MQELFDYLVNLKIGEGCLFFYSISSFSTSMSVSPFFHFSILLLQMYVLSLSYPSLLPYCILSCLFASSPLSYSNIIRLHGPPHHLSLSSRSPHALFCLIQPPALLSTTPLPPPTRTTPQKELSMSSLWWRERRREVTGEVGRTGKMQIDR